MLRKSRLVGLVANPGVAAILALLPQVGHCQPPRPAPDEIAVKQSISQCSTVALVAALPASNLPFTYGIAAIAGAPYSGVGVTESATTFIDGNRIARNETTLFYRDSQGRTRVERTISPLLSALNSQAMAPMVMINDPVSGHCYALHTRQKVAYVIPYVIPLAATPNVVHPPVAPPTLPGANLSTPGFNLSGSPGFDFSAAFAAPELGSEVSLGEHMIEGTRVVGTRINHIVRTGTLGNQKAISITVEQWFSPDLGVLVQDTQRSTIGGEINYKLAQIVRAEPDAGLFRVPPDYTRQELPVRYGSQLTSKPLSPAVRIKP
jgi:hypothetical protein